MPFFQEVILENCSFAKQEVITSLTVIKAESIPTDVYLDIYVTGKVNVHMYKICADIYRCS